MLRIRYKGRKTVFEIELERKDAADHLAGHLAHFGRESVKDPATGETITRPVPREDVIAEWIEGDKVEPLPIPGLTPTTAPGAVTPATT